MRCGAMRVQRDRMGDSVSQWPASMSLFGVQHESGVRAAVAHVMEPPRRSPVVGRWRGKCGSYRLRRDVHATCCLCRTALPDLSADLGRSSRTSKAGNQLLCMIPLTRLEHT